MSQSFMPIPTYTKVSDFQSLSRDVSQGCFAEIILPKMNK